jgi:hypothetical protein
VAPKFCVSNGRRELFQNGFPRWGYIFLTKTKEGQMLYFEEWKVLGATLMCSTRRKSILRCGKLSN